ncbi:hypothetical protein Fmac_008373 [Flemingia macrophylla]|uniref:Uncharacterized protein n=1 Tax=Flemingia macrophylla TaxID=520843 RepID=A0ABD1MX82_9FABA
MELNKIKKQVDNVEATKAKAISELESAKEILQNLITKLANKEQGEVKGKKHAVEAIAANLTVELQNSREKSRPEPFKLVLVEAKDAKAAEETPVKEINILSEAKECEDLVEKKEAIVMAELQQIYAKKNEVDRKVETNLNAIEETKAAIETTLWSAEIADSAKAAIEIELFRYHQQQQKLVPGTPS